MKSPLCYFTLLLVSAGLSHAAVTAADIGVDVPAVPEPGLPLLSLIGVFLLLRRRR